MSPVAIYVVGSIGQLAFDTVEVWGSSPHGPTTLSNTLERFRAIPQKLHR
jgi:hypothetical protein